MEKRHLNLCSKTATCSHTPKLYILPVRQRENILDNISSDTRQKKQNLVVKNRAKTASDSDCIDLLRVITQKSISNDVAQLLDKYKKVTFFYYDRKRKRQNDFDINTKFVISTKILKLLNGNKNRNEKIQQQKFLSKYPHLFKFILSKEHQKYFIQQGLLARSSKQQQQPQQVYLMLHDELNDILKEDTDYSGISISDFFTLPYDIINQINDRT
ncbi:unnamed protein product [Didymodactylos carnosus]|uniref:Uncharacterized protein n=1 Tax=Didymodactylos carnosus TaxID=1234261 RepID=A0A813UHT9_9BILA|nr:unnamed protein product [Didymodactylos carnosus]CAF0823602.1 unnamed protein product [Didymodactylos carnosus]CAF3583503.1 unnamed protein product [Didymodactylos carnosus]CAF3610227.1 unnamed protein product [Didymodactylos carnosus]